MKKALIISGLLLILQNSYAQNIPQIDEHQLKKHILYLASDNLKGRKSGTTEAITAAKYIRKKMKSAELKLLYQNGFQWFDVVVAYHYGKRNSFITGDHRAEPGRDFVPMIFSADTSLTAEMVFAGFGFDIHSDQFSWNDYENIEVKDKIVIIFNGEPDIKERNSPFSDYSSDHYKAMVASDKGAAGVIFIYPAHEKKGNSLPRLSYSKVNSRSTIPVIQMTAEFANHAIFSEIKPLEALEKIITENKTPYSFLLNKKCTLSTEILIEKGKTCNVAGMIEGSDPLLKHEYIVIGAHYDHLGMGGPGSGSRYPETFAIHNGADDNASGVAGMLELAGMFKYSASEIKRSIIFVAFTGEEMGLLGSSKFTNHPPVDLNQIKAMINLDMIGRADTISKYLLIGGTGTAQENDSLFRIFEKNYHFDFKKMPEGLGPSDHASFYAKNIPVLFVSTGAHNDYHLWSDDEDKINYKGMVQVLKFVYDLGKSYANLPQAPVFTEAGPKTKSVSGAYKVTLGILPDFSATELKGLKVQSVRFGGPAQIAGMQNGDIITAINGTTINNIYDYMNRLKSLKNGDIVTVEVIRDGIIIILFVQL